MANVNILSSHAQQQTASAFTQRGLDLQFARQKSIELLCNDLP